MAQVLVVGSGDHAKVVLEILEDMEDVSIVGCVAKDPESFSILDYHVLGDDSILPALYRTTAKHAIVAIGDCKIRLAMTLHLKELGFSLINAISPRAVVSRRAQIGDGVAVMAGAVINVDAEIGDSVIVNTGSTVDHDCRIGRCAHIAPGAHLAGRVQIGEGAFIGIGACLIPRVKVGEWSTIGAGSVVVRDIPAHVTAMGVPATVHRRSRSC